MADETDLDLGGLGALLGAGNDEYDQLLLDEVLYNSSDSLPSMGSSSQQQQPSPRDALIQHGRRQQAEAKRSPDQPLRYTEEDFNLDEELSFEGDHSGVSAAASGISEGDGGFPAPPTGVSPASHYATAKPSSSSASPAGAISMASSSPHAYTSVHSSPHSAASIEAAMESMAALDDHDNASNPFAKHAHAGSGGGGGVDRFPFMDAMLDDDGDVDGLLDSRGGGGGSGASPLDSSSMRGMSASGRAGSQGNARHPRTLAEYPEGPAWLPGFLTTAYWAPYFDFSTAKIKDRLFRAMFPVFPGPFLRSPRDHPDLYAPFWITTSLIVVLAVSGNLASYLDSADDDRWDASFEHLAFAASVFYGWLLLLPPTAYLALRFAGTHKPLAELACLYGYALAVWIPSSCLLMVPVDWLRIAACVLSAVLSAVFLVRNLAVGTVTARFVMLDSLDADGTAAEDDGLEMGLRDSSSSSSSLSPAAGSASSSSSAPSTTAASEILYDPQDQLVPREQRAGALLVLAAAFFLQLLLGLVVKINFFPNELRR